MKTKRPRPSADPDMRAEYDFSNGVRGKFAGMFPPNCRLVTFDPDLTSLFDSRGSGDICERFKVFAQRRGRTADGERLVTSFALSEQEYRALRPLLKRLGAKVSQPRSEAFYELARAKLRQQIEDQAIAKRPRRKVG